MLTLERIDPAVLQRREEAYKRHLDLVATPHDNRQKLAETLRTRYSSVTPEHFEGSRLVTGPGTKLDKDVLEETFGIPGIFHIYPATIEVLRWDSYKDGWRSRLGLGEALGRGPYGGCMNSKLYFPEGSEMRIRLIDEGYQTPHEDIHHAIRLVRGTPNTTDEIILEEVLAMYTDVIFGIRSLDSSREEAISHLKDWIGKDVTLYDRLLIDQGVRRLEELSIYLTPKGIFYTALESQSIGTFAKRDHLKEINRLPDELKDAFRK